MQKYAKEDVQLFVIYGPELHPGDKKAEDRFKELNGAYDILGDAAKRARFDRGEIDANGTEIRQNPFAGGRGRAQGGGQARSEGGSQARAEARHQARTQAGEEA